MLPDPHDPKRLERDRDRDILERAVSPTAWVMA